MVPCDISFKVLSPRGRFLTGRGANFTSQFGEDGLIEAALEQFGAIHRWCFEVGAHDGLFYSNTARLRESGWDCVLIEGESEHYEKLRQFQSERVRTVAKRIRHNSLDQILKECGAPWDLDFGVIDIDGQDYWAWAGLREFRPRLMLVEFEYASEEAGDKFPECDGAGQASFQAIVRLGRDKNYEPLAKTACNILFVANDL